MKYTELKNSLKEGASSVYLLEGDDAYFRLNGEELIKSAFLQMPEMNYSSYEGESLKGSAMTEFVAALKNYPFMSEKRIVKVSEFYPAEHDFERYLKPLFADFPKSSILIIANSVAKKGVELKRRREITYVDCNKADRDSVAKWIYITLKRSGIKTQVSVCEAVADYCLCDMARVSVETKKIIDYKPDGELTKVEADMLVYKDSEYRIYEMNNAVANRNYGAFCSVAEDLKRRGMDEISILNSLYAYFRNLLTVVTSNRTSAELSKLLKMKEFGVSRSREQARSLGKDKISMFVNYIYSKISEVKSGITTPQSAFQNTKNMIFFGGELNTAL